LTLLFRKNQAEKIVNGAKTATRRPSRPMVRPGGTYRIRVDFFSYLPDRIKVNSLYRQRLGDMTPRDALDEGYASLEEFRRGWEVLYGRWEEDEAVWVVEFEHIGPDRNP